MACLFLGVWLGPTRSQAQTVVINELMPAPTSQGVEFIELLFWGDAPISLSSLSLRDANDRWSQVHVSRPLAATDTLVLVRSLQEVPLSFHPGINLGVLSPWPALNNGGDSLFVRLNGVVVDKMGYSSSKSGRSWERIQPRIPGRMASNWAVSVDEEGSTPGHTNSVFVDDVAPPSVLGAETVPGDNVAMAGAGSLLLVWFSEPLPPEPSARVVVRSRNQTDTVVEAFPTDNLLSIPWPHAFAPETLLLEPLVDYAGNVSNPIVTIVAGSPLPGDVTVSEIMFNPLSSPGSGELEPELLAGSEFIEFVNTSPYPIALHRIMVSVSPKTGSSPVSVFVDNKPVFMGPGGLGVFYFPESSSPQSNSPRSDSPQANQNPPAGEAAFFLPTTRSLSLDDARGWFRLQTLVGGDGLVYDGPGAPAQNSPREIEYVAYHEEDHYPGLASTKGRSLHRPVLNATDWTFGSWTSTTTASGATPGRFEALQKASTAHSTEALIVTPLSFYPDYFSSSDIQSSISDSDKVDFGHEIQIHVTSEVAGHVATIEVFDRQGYRVRTLTTARFVDSGFSVRWDGQTNEYRPSPAGVYIVVATVKTASGRIASRMMQPVALLRKDR